MNPNLKVGDSVVLHHGGKNYHYTLKRIYAAEDYPEPVCRVENGIGELICRQSEIEPEKEFIIRERGYAPIIEAWNAGLRKTKDIAERLCETNLRSLGQRISACKQLGLIT